MIRTIDRSKTHLVQKVYSPRGETIAYQAVPIDLVGDASLITRCSTLAEAREIAKSTVRPSVAQQSCIVTRAYLPSPAPPLRGAGDCPSKTTENDYDKA